MRLNYSKFLQLVLRSIESEVEFDVYHSFLLSSIVVTIEFEYQILNLFFIAHLLYLTEIYKFQSFKLYQTT